MLNNLLHDLDVFLSWPISPSVDVPLMEISLLDPVNKLDE